MFSRTKESSSWLKSIATLVEFSQSCTRRERHEDEVHYLVTSYSRGRYKFAPRGRALNRGQAAGSTAGATRQRPNDLMDEGDKQEDEARHFTEHNHEMQREQIAVELTASCAPMLALQLQVVEAETKALEQETT